MHAPSLDQFGEQFTNAQAGCDAATEQLVREYYGPLTAFFERRGAHDPESSANDAIERAIRHGDPERIDSGPAFRAFLYAIARNQAKNEFRTRERRVVIDLVEEPIDLDQSTAAPSAEAVVFDGIYAHDLLAQVKPDQAEVLELRFVDGYSVKETASLVGKSVPAVNALQRRGLATLRQVIGAIVLIALVVAGVRYATERTERGPVISEDLPSEIGELPADGDGSTENGAPLIVETEDPESPRGKEGVKTDPEVEVAGISSMATIDVTESPQSRLLDDFLDGLANGNLEATTTTAVPVAVVPAAPQTQPVTTTPTVTVPSAEGDGTEVTVDVTLPWTGESAPLPSLPAPLIRPQGQVAPEVIEDQDAVASPTTTVAPSPTTTAPASSSTSTSSSSSSSTSSTIARNSVSPAPTPDESGVIPEAISEPVGDAFGAIKSIVTSPVGWFQDTTDAIDITE